MSPFAVNRKAILGGCAAGLVGAGLGVHLTSDDVSTETVARHATRQPAPSRVVARAEGNDPTVVALRYVLNGQSLLDAGPDGVDAILGPVVAPGARRGLVEENRRNVARVHAELSGATGPILWRQAPLAVRAETRGELATVAVWHVGVLSAPGAAPPQSHWSTSTVELAQQEGEWRVTAETAVDGPVPLNPGDTAPSEPEAFDDALSGFGPLGAA